MKIMTSGLSRRIKDSNLKLLSEDINDISRKS